MRLEFRSLPGVRPRVIPGTSEAVVDRPLDRARKRVRMNTFCDGQCSAGTGESTGGMQSRGCVRAMCVRSLRAALRPRRRKPFVFCR
jgi:hypothetical protein